jgi:hypothetical protein
VAVSSLRSVAGHLGLPAEQLQVVPGVVAPVEELGPGPARRAPCDVVRAHRLGPAQRSAASPRQVDAARLVPVSGQRLEQPEAYPAPVDAARPVPASAPRLEQPEREASGPPPPGSEQRPDQPVGSPPSEVSALPGPGSGPSDQLAGPLAEAWEQARASEPHLPPGWTAALPVASERAPESNPHPRSDHSVSTPASALVSAPQPHRTHPRNQNPRWTRPASSAPEQGCPRRYRHRRAPEPDHPEPATTQPTLPVAPVSRQTHRPTDPTHRAPTPRSTTKRPAPDYTAGPPTNRTTADLSVRARPHCTCAHPTPPAANAWAFWTIHHPIECQVCYYRQNCRRKPCIERTPAAVPMPVTGLTWPDRFTGSRSRA